MKNRSKILMVILPVVACFAFLPGAQAQCVDGCNNLFGTFQGDGALINNGVGSGNTAFGWRALFFTSATSFNTAVGGGALALNNSNDNVAVGAAALLTNTAGADNVAVGTDVLVFSNGSDNNAIGSFALFNNIGGSSNNALGFDALVNSLGDFNTAIGDEAGNTITTGTNNICIGTSAGSGIVDGADIIAIGSAATGVFANVGPTTFIGGINE